MSPSSNQSACFPSPSGAKQQDTLFLSSSCSQMRRQPSATVWGDDSPLTGEWGDLDKLGRGPYHVPLCWQHAY